MKASSKLVTTRLDLAGYKTFIARDGYRALEVIYATSPHGVVLDIRHAEPGRFGVLRSLRSSVKFPRPSYLTARKI